MTVAVVSLIAGAVGAAIGYLARRHHERRRIRINTLASQAARLGRKRTR